MNANVPKKRSQGTYGCVYYPSIPCESSSKIKDNANYITKIQKDNSVMRNEQEIAIIIQEKIPNYEHYFGPIHDVCEVDLSKLEENNKCDILNEEKKQVINSYRIKYLGESAVDKQLELWHGNLNERDYAMRVIDMIIYVLFSLNKILTDGEILHNDTKCNNIMYYEKNYSPIIIDFGLSISLEKGMDKIKLNFQSDKSIFWLYGFEYMLLNKINTTEKINVQILKKYLDEFIEKYSFNEYVTESTKSKIKAGYLNQIDKWTNKQTSIDKNTLFETIFNSSKETWDLYSFMTDLISRINPAKKGEQPKPEEKHKDTIQEITKICLDTIVKISKGTASISSTIEEFENLLQKKAKIGFLINKNPVKTEPRKKFRNGIQNKE